MLVAGWLAFRAGAVELKGYLPFLGHIVVGIFIVFVAAALLLRVRHIFAVGVLLILGLAIEEVIRWQATAGSDPLISIPTLTVCRTSYLLARGGPVAQQ